MATVPPSPADHDDPVAEKPLAPESDWRTSPTARLAGSLRSGPEGLAESEAARRLAVAGPNSLAVVSRRSELAEFASLLVDPLVLILLMACAVSAALGEPVNAAIIAAIVASNVVLNAVQLHRSRRAVDALRARVALSATVMRGGQERVIPVREIVPGDVVRLAAGNVVPADGRLLESRDLNIDESMLTGESLPAARSAGAADIADANVFFGSSVLTGTAGMLAVATGKGTVYGEIAASLAQRAPETAFERGIRQFASMIMRLVFALILGVVLVNLVLKRDPLESFLFGIALATGLTPELLPMVTSVTLARGAVRMAREQVIVKRLPAIQNLGSMDILCSDKTGTLTFGAARVDAATGPLGDSMPDVLALAATNSALQAGMSSPLDAAILRASAPLPHARVDELPFDATRRMLSVIVREPGGEITLIAKGAPEQVIAACDSWQNGGENRPLDRAAGDRIRDAADGISAAGRRTLAVATRRLPAGRGYGHEDESALTLRGFVTFLDPPRPDAGEAVRGLAADGVRVVILTGDHPLVAMAVCREIGIDPGEVKLGADIDRLTEPALGALAERTSVFARVSPDQKLRILRALRARGHVVGFLGDGVNDAPSLHAADVGVSVANGTDVARQAAEVILLRQDLRVLHAGVIEGRRSFGNVMKYISMNLSSSFGNTLSMAASALVLPFLPLMPLQVLLNDLLYDLSQLALPLDAVDPEALRRPAAWDISAVRRFMLAFGLLSSLVDFATFFLLLRVFGASEDLFHTGWFVESLATQVLVVYVIRTSGGFRACPPAAALIGSTPGCLVLGLALPWSPFAGALGFVPLPARLCAALAALVVVYLAAAQLEKRRLHRAHAAPREGFQARKRQRFSKFGH